MSSYDDRDYYQRRDDFYRELDRRHADFRDDMERTRQRRLQEYDQAQEAMRKGDTLRALSHLDPELALRYAESVDHASSLPTSTNNGFHLVETMRFFESGYDLTAESERSYATRFPQQSTRYVCTQLTLNNPFQVIDYRGEITVHYIQPDGSLLGSPTDDIQMYRSQRTNTYTTGWGWRTAGRWPAGDYRIEVWIDNRLTAQGAFTIAAASLTDILNGLATSC